MSSGKSSRQKGQRGEREAVKFAARFFPAAKRGLGQARSGGDVPDVDGTPLWIEVKRRSGIAALRFLGQALEATDGRLPVVLMREDDDPRWVAMLDAGALFALINEKETTSEEL